MVGAVKGWGGVVWCGCGCSGGGGEEAVGSRSTKLTFLNRTTSWGNNHVYQTKISVHYHLQ